MKVVEYMHEYIIKEPFTVEVMKTNYGIDVAMDKYVLTKVCEYGERLSLERIVRCRDCKFAGSLEGSTTMLDCTGRLATTWDYYNDEPQENPVEPDGFCAWGEREVE